MLRTENITMQFGGLTAVSNFCLEINKGEIIGLIGPNGAGKTTAFNMITGVYTPTKGKVLVKGKDNSDIDITSFNPDAITKLGIARTFQNIRLFNSMTVLENVLVGTHLRTKSSILQTILGTSQSQKEVRDNYDFAIELLRKVDLIDVANEIATSLPYGKQRRLEIARALATQPKILLLDEPAAGMNDSESMELMSFIAEIRDEFNLSILMIEHHMKVVMGVCERIYVLDHGVTIAQGKPSEIQSNEKVIEAYLGVDA